MGGRVLGLALLDRACGLATADHLIMHASSPCLRTAWRQLACSHARITMSAASAPIEATSIH